MTCFTLIGQIAIKLRYLKLEFKLVCVGAPGLNVGKHYDFEEETRMHFDLFHCASYAANI